VRQHADSARTSCWAACTRLRTSVLSVLFCIAERPARLHSRDKRRALPVSKARQQCNTFEYRTMSGGVAASAPCSASTLTAI
jgi:hypothetical protein